MPPSAEAPLAYLGFQLVAPCRELRPFVSAYWHFQRETPLAVYQDEYMHPRGGFGVAFNLGDPVRLDAQLITDPVFLDGANTVSRRMGFFGHIELMGVRFYEGGAYPFLGLPLHELCNETTVLDALDRPGLQRLHARLMEATSVASRIGLLEQWLMARLALGKERDALIPASLAQLREQGGDVSVAALAQDFAISQRQLERLYQGQVGLSPKQYAQLVRVERARRALRQTGEHAVARVAADLGYYDQSHFIREFSAVIGMTPSAYRQGHRR
jgi:AraC-like DNA-binding protein